MKITYDKQCIFILADGARADLFEHLLNNGDLPNIARYIVEEGSYTNGVSVFPSTTGPAYIPYLLGKFPGRCNLPGIRWFDRKVYSRKKFSLSRFRSYIGLETYLINRDLDSGGVPTLFELFPESISILNEITRGINPGGDRTKYSKMYYKLKSHFTNSSDDVDEVSGRILIRAAESSPRFIFSVFMGVDTYSHQLHPFHRSVLDSYCRIDRYVGELCRSLKRCGRLDNTLIILGSDHGLTSTHSHFDSLRFMDDLGYRTFYYPNIFKHILNADAANMVSGNSMAHLYFRNRAGWDKPTCIEEIEGVAERLAERDEIDMVMGMDNEGKIVIKNQNGTARTWIEDDSINYCSDNGDPLGLNLDTKSMSLDRQLVNTYDTDYPDCLLQIAQLFDSARTGDLVISAKRGYDLRARHENPEHCSSHGSLDKDHMKVPIAINRPIRKRYVRTVDIYPTIVNFLGKDIPENVDGVDLLNGSQNEK